MDETRTENRILNRNNYSNRTISVFQIIGAYLSDIYYNHLYTEAQKLKTNGKTSTVTEGYRNACYAFLSALDVKCKEHYKVEHYNQLLTGINEYFQTWTSFNTLTISECMNKISKEFVPDDYYNELDRDNKRTIVRNVLIDCIRETTKMVIVDYLESIIDNHDEEENIEIIKEKIVDILILEREKMFHKFLERAGGTSEDKVDKKFLDKILLELDKLNKEKKILVQTIENSESDLKKRIEQLSGLVKKCRVLESKCSSLEKQNEDYKSNINALTGKLQSLSVENNRLNGLIEEQKNVIDSYVPVKSSDSYLKSVDFRTNDLKSSDSKNTDSKNTDSKNIDSKNTIVKKQVDLKDNIAKSDLIKSVLTNSDSESSDSDDSDEKSVSSKKSSSSQSTVKLEKLPRNFKNKLGISPGLDFFD
jgi:hypothetical protein